MTMTERLTDLLAHLFSFDITADLLRRDFVQQALLAAALLALVSGLDRALHRDAADVVRGARLQRVVA